MGRQGATNVPKKESAWQVKEPYQVFIEFYEAPPGRHSLHKDPGLDAKGRPKDGKMKLHDRKKNLSEFLLNFMRSCHDLTFFTRTKGGITRCNQMVHKMKMSDMWKNLASFY